MQLYLGKVLGSCKTVKEIDGGIRVGCRIFEFWTVVHSKLGVTVRGGTHYGKWGVGYGGVWLLSYLNATGGGKRTMIDDRTTANVRYRMQHRFTFLCCGIEDTHLIIRESAIIFGWRPPSSQF